MDNQTSSPLLLVNPGNPSRWDCHSDSLSSFQIKHFSNIHHAPMCGLGRECQMFRSQGRYFTEGEVKRIVMLLRGSDMSLPEIADRMRCSRNAIASINRKFQIRRYDGRRSQWSLNNCIPDDGREAETDQVTSLAAETL